MNNKIDKYTTSISKNVSIDKLDDIVNKYNNKYHRTIKLKPVDIKSSIFFDLNRDNNKEGPKFKVGDHVKMSKHKNIFSKRYVPNWSGEVFVNKRIKNTFPWPYVISNLND